MNPNWIGIHISENNKEIKSKIFNWSDDSRKDDNKRNFETSQIAHSIMDMAIHYQCGQVVMEDLNMGAKNAGKGRRYNKLVNNEWNRTQFQWVIEKLCNKYGIACKKVNCAYSSTIGNILNRNLPDPCAAAQEIGRRGKYQYIKKLCMYPEVNFDNIEHLNQWKEEGIDLTKANSWVELHNLIKGYSYLKYRVPLDKFKSKKLVFFSAKSGIITYSDFISL